MVMVLKYVRCCLWLPGGAGAPISFPFTVTPGDPERNLTHMNNKLCRSRCEVSFLSLTGILVVGDQTQDVSGLTVDVEAHGQFTERELHHKVGVAVR